MIKIRGNDCCYKIETNMKDYNIDVIRQRYSVVPRTLVFIRKEEQFLLIHKKKKDSYGFGKFNGVGGHIEKGEDPYSSARREILEETGLTIGSLELAAILFIDIGDTPGVEVFVFIAEYSGGEIKPSDEGSLSWKTLSEIKSSDQILNDLPMLIETCIEHRTGEKPQFIKYTYDENEAVRIDIIRD